jgi:hypothetical protein
MIAQGFSPGLVSKEKRPESIFNPGHAGRNPDFVHHADTPLLGSNRIEDEYENDVPHEWRPKDGGPGISCSR